MSFFKGRLAQYVRFLLLSCVMGAGLLSIIATGGGDDAGSETGTLSIGLTDGSTDDYQAVYVTIKEVQVHHADGDWETVGYPGDLDTGKTYDLLELRNGVIEQLVLTDLDPGNFTQMRLILGDVPDDEHPYANYIIDSEGKEKELKIPSGFQSGIKLVHPFTISAGGITELVLDVIVPKSIVRTGSGKYILKPTIKIIDTTVSFATVSGTVTVGGNGEPAPMEGVTVSAQYYNSENEPVIQSSTSTDENGFYKMILPEDISYNIVAYYDGYAPSCIADVLLATGENLTDQDFTLTETATGSVSGNISITGGGEEDSALLSFRQDCNGTFVEVKSVTVGYDSASDNWTYSITLPEGANYSGIASVNFDGTEEIRQLTSGGSNTFNVTGDMDTSLDTITFPVQ